MILQSALYPIVQRCLVEYYPEKVKAICSYTFKACKDDDICILNLSQPFHEGYWPVCNPFFMFSCARHDYEESFEKVYGWAQNVRKAWDSYKISMDHLPRICYLVLSEQEYQAHFSGSPEKHLHTNNFLTQAHAALEIGDEYVRIVTKYEAYSSYFEEWNKRRTLADT